MSDVPDTALNTSPEPLLCFDDSRRLMGANRHFAGPATTLTPLGPVAQDAAAHARWAWRVSAVAACLGWPDVQAHAKPMGAEVALLMAAPADHLMTATELGEWAWERCTAEACAAATVSASEPTSSASAAAPVSMTTAAQSPVGQASVAEASTRLPRHPFDDAGSAGGISGRSGPGGPCGSSDSSGSSGSSAKSDTSDTSDTSDIPGFDLAQPAFPDIAAAAQAFARRASAESRPALAALRAAASARGLPLLVDDERVSVGAGEGSWNWPLPALPAPEDVPWSTLRDVPTALVTGSNGKTTTVRLVAAMLQAAGFATGQSSTTGISVAGQTVAAGDYAGPAGAREVLRHRSVQAAVLETARGGILRRGLALQRADVAVVTNISADHFGEYGVNSLADLAEVKLVVAHAVAASGCLVLNADDAVLMAAAARLPHAAAARHALFAADHGQPALAALRASGGSTCGVAQGQLLLSRQGQSHRLGAVADLPLVHGGAARHNLANLAAAALAALHLGVPVATIAATAARFGLDPLDNAGRLERWAWQGATVLVDYAHNPDGLTRLLEVARAMQPRRLLLLLGQAGNRSNEAIAELARAAAAFRPDGVVLKDMGETYRRGRAVGEVPALLRAALAAAGVPTVAIHDGGDEAAAVQRLLGQLRPGDVAVMPTHETAVREALSAQLKAQQQRPEARVHPEAAGAHAEADGDTTPSPCKVG